MIDDNLRRKLLARIHMDPRYKKIKENDAWEMWLDARFE